MKLPATVNGAMLLALGLTLVLSWRRERSWWRVARMRSRPGELRARPAVGHGESGQTTADIDRGISRDVESELLDDPLAVVRYNSERDARLA